MMYSQPRPSHLKVAGEYEINNPRIRAYNIPPSYFKNIEYPTNIEHDPLWTTINLMDPLMKESISSSLLPLCKVKGTRKEKYDLIYAEQKIIADGYIVRKGFFLNKDEKSIAVLSSSNCNLLNVRVPGVALKEGWFVHKGVSAPLKFWYEATKYCKEHF